MKVKLLKKIRNKYSIVYYPNGVIFGDRVYNVKKYIVHKNNYQSVWDRCFLTKNEAIDYILRMVTRKYRRLIKKDFYKGTKVW